MIPFPFEYIRPDTVEQAVGIYGELYSRGKAPLYWGGGTEIITMSRVNNLRFGAVIDIKGIAQCREMAEAGGRLVLGAAVTLNTIAMSGVFPLLGQACARVADHTAQCKITLGGNVAGTIIYREAALPLLLADADVTLAGPAGVRETKLASLVPGHFMLPPGEMIVCFTLDSRFTKMPFAHAKHTDGEKIGYPLVTLAAIKKDVTIDAAVAGFAPRPVLLRLPLPVPSGRQQAVDQMLGQLRDPPLTDTLGSGAYRKKLLGEALGNMMVRLEDGP